MLKFLATIETGKSKIRKTESITAEKLSENQSGVKLLFAICPLIINLSRAVLFTIEIIESDSALLLEQRKH